MAFHLETLTQYLADLSWQGGVILALGFLVSGTFLRRQSPRYTRAFWIAVFLVIPVLPAVSRLSFEHHLPVNSITQITSSASSDGRIFDSYVPGEMQLTPSSYLDDLQSFPEAPPGLSIGEILTVAYLSVAAFLTLLTLVAVFRVRYWTYKGTPITDERVINAFEEAKANLAIKAPCFLLEGDASDSPLSLGIFNYRILLPRNAADRFSGDELRDLAHHELCHIRQIDPFVFAYAAVLRSFLFINPLIWMATHRVRLLSEFCADETAIRQSGRVKTYAQLLVRIAEELPANRRTLLAANAVAGKSELLQRVEWLIQSRSSSGTTKPTSFKSATAVLISAVAVTTIAAALPWFPVQPSALTTHPREARREIPSEIATTVNDMLNVALPIKVINTGQWYGSNVTDTATYLILRDADAQNVEISLNRNPHSQSFGAWYLGGTHPNDENVAELGLRSDRETALRLMLLSWVDQRYSREEWESIVQVPIWPSEPCDLLHALVIDEVLDSSLRFQSAAPSS
ncbi:MAG: M56 family metallopeptidase [Verrucomicrobiota bacterium]